MKNYLKIFCFFVLFILVACGGPPEGTKETNLINLVYDKLNELNAIRNDRLAQKKFFENLTDNFNFLFAFKKDSSLVIKGKEAIPTESTLLYTIDGNRFMTAKPIYITVENKKFAISLDNKTYYSTETDAKKNIVGLKNDYFFEPVFENNNKLIINYSMAFSIGEIPEIVQVDPAKKIINLKKGLIFSDTNKENINIDFKDAILFVPENTMLLGSMKVDGNLIRSKTDNGIITIMSMMDIYVYLTKNRFAISFDKINWNVSILSFDIKPVINVKSTEDNVVYFDIYTSAVYDKDKKSMSVIQLLLNMM